MAPASLSGRVTLLRRREKGSFLNSPRILAFAVAALVLSHWLVASSLPPDESDFRESKALERDFAWQVSECCWWVRFFLASAIGIQCAILFARRRCLRLRRLLEFANADFEHATHALVETAGTLLGENRIVPLEKAALRGTGLALSLSLEGERYLCVNRKGEFIKVINPEHASVDAYVRWHGLLDDEDATENASVSFISAGTASPLGGETESVRRARAAYGSNRCIIPKVSFKSIFVSQIQSPFFLFQVFSISLWLLDEYWSYPLTSLFLIILVEAQQSFKTWRDVNRIRSMAPLATQVYVHRRRARDVFLLAPDGGPAPADCILVRGSALLDESMLTGTRVLGSDFPEKDAWACCRVPQEGAVAVAVRTAFSTSQGQLLRVLIQRTEGPPQTSREGWIFLLLLLGLACLCCCYVALASPLSPISYHSATLNPRLEEFLRSFQPLRSRGVGADFAKSADASYWRLFLTTAEIVTSVVPVELPLMLSLALSMGILQLARRGICCTDAQRLAKAGQVRVAAFDKTGTLTLDSYRLLAVLGVSGLPRDADVRRLGLSNFQSSNCVSTTPLQCEELPMLSALAVGACHSLCQPSGRGGSSVSSSNPSAPIGDPLEVAAFSALGWKFVSKRHVVLESGGRVLARLKLILQIPFASRQQRATAVASFETVDSTWKGQSASNGPSDTSPPSEAFRGELRQSALLRDQLRSDGLMVAVKGAPERVRDLLSFVPPFYDEASAMLAGQGLRVLALAVKVQDARESLSGLSRDHLEKGLSFAGFLVFAAPLKQQAHAVVSVLQRSGVQTVVLTGDHPLSAFKVALDVGVLPTRRRMREACLSSEPVMVLRRNQQAKDKDGDEAGRSLLSDLVWMSFGDDPMGSSHHVSLEAGLNGSFDKDGKSPGRGALCVDGDALALLLKEAKGEERKEASLRRSLLARLVRRVRVFARLSPNQKRKLVEAFQDQGFPVLMCGDGINDVAALKAADVGVSVKSESFKKYAGPQSRARKSRSTDELTDALFISPEDALLTQAPVSASIASSFSSRRGDLDCCVEVVGVGRGALASTLLLLRLAALNSVATAFCLSVLAVDGVKFADSQGVLESLLTSALTLAVNSGAEAGGRSSSKSKSESDFEKMEMGCCSPISSVFYPPVFLSTMLQALVHLTCVCVAWQQSAALSIAEVTTLLDPSSSSPLSVSSSSSVSSPLSVSSSSSLPTEEDGFRPNPSSTCVYLLQLCMHLSAFFANYEGAPYALSLRRNKALSSLLFLGLVLILLLLLDLLPPLTRILQLSPLPDPLRLHTLMLIAADLFVPWAINALALKISKATRKAPTSLDEECD